MFLAAGTLDFSQAWVFIPVFVVTMSAYMIYLSIKNPAHIERRKQEGPAGKQFMLQKIIVTVGQLGPDKAPSAKVS